MHSEIAFPDPALGYFSKLPPEVRLLIWQLLVPKSPFVKLEPEKNKSLVRASGLSEADPSWRRRPKKILPLLLTSRPISLEFTGALQKRVLCYSIDPKGDWFAGHMGHGKELADFSRFKQLRLVLHAPLVKAHSDARTQLDEFWFHVTRLESYLLGLEAHYIYTYFRHQRAMRRSLAAQEPPEMELMFVDDRNVLWDNAAIGNVQEQQPDVDQILEWLELYEKTRGIKYIISPQAYLGPGAKAFLKAKFKDHMQSRSY